RDDLVTGVQTCALPISPKYTPQYSQYAHHQIHKTGPFSPRRPQPRGTDGRTIGVLPSKWFPVQLSRRKQSAHAGRLASGDPRKACRDGAHSTEFTRSVARGPK